MVYAPPPYDLAMRMMKFFNGNNHPPKGWESQEILAEPGPD